MKNIVTIDFDIIMAPCINLYNDWIESQNYTIHNVLSNFPFLENMNADLIIYKRLTEYIMKVIQFLDAEQIHFIDSHEDIQKFINEKDITIYNIDHHHDIAYGQTRQKINIPLLEPHCSNWVKFLKDSNRLKEYIWINNDNSELLFDDILKYYPTKTIKFKDFNLDGLVEKTDMLCICKSSAWILPSYLPLFDLWKTICEKHYQQTFKTL